MKAVHAIPPAIALVAVILWNLPRRPAEKAVEAEARGPRGRVERTGENGIGAVAKARRPKAVAQTGPLDWRALAASMRKSRQSDEGDELPELAGFYERLSEMSREQLLASLDEVAALGLEEEDAGLLEEALVEPLIALDPELALTKFSGKIQDDPDGVGSQLSAALEGWAEKDLAAATAWLDHEIAAGAFEARSLDGQSEARIEFEAALAGVLLATDAAAAGRRIAALPEDQRAAALEQVTLTDLEPAALREFVDLVRNLVPEDEREGPLAMAVSERVPEGDYQEAATFLDDIRATPAERAAAAEWVAGSRLTVIAEERPLDRQDVAALRQWLKRQAPATVDALTGKALGAAAVDLDETAFPKLAEIVLEVQRSGGGDDVLVAFIEAFGVAPHADRLRGLAEKIADASRRQKVLDSLE